MNIHSILKNKLFGDSLWTLVGTALGKGLTVLSGIIIAKLLGKEIFGEYGLLKNTLLLIAIFSTMGLGYTSTIFVSNYKQYKENLLYSLIKGILTITTIFSGIIAIFTFIFAHQIATYLEDTSLTIGLRYLSITIIFNAITTSQIGILAGFKLFKKTAYINIVSGICNFILSIILTYTGGFNGALLALLLAQIINCILNYIILRSQIKNIKSSQKAPLKPILLQSLPIALQEMSLSITSWLSPILLLKLTNYGEVGIYSAATQWTAIILFIPIVLRNVTLSHLSSNKNNKQHSRILFTMMGIYILSTFIPATLVILFSNHIMTFYGTSFTGLHSVLLVTCYSTVFNSIYNAFSSEFMSKNKNWYIYGITLFRDGCTLLCTYIFIKILLFDGAFSLGLSTLSMGFITVILCWLFYLHFTKKITV